MEDDLNDDAPVEPTPYPGVIISGKWYERLKWFTLIALPALSAFYIGLSAIWPQIPAPTQVVGTISLITVLLGALLGISSKNFRKGGGDGSINAKIVGDTVQLSKLQLPDISPEALAKRKMITIMVNPPSQ